MQCCACNRVHAVTLKGENQTEEEPSSDAHEDATCDLPKPDVPCGSRATLAEPSHMSSSSSSCVQQEPASSNVRAVQAALDAKQKTAAAKPRSKAKSGATIPPNEVTVCV